MWIGKRITWKYFSINFGLVFRIVRLRSELCNFYKNGVVSMCFFPEKLSSYFLTFITFLCNVITFLCSLLDDHFITFLAGRCYIPMQLIYYISMQNLLHFYAGITFLCKRITFLCRYYISMQLLHFYALQGNWYTMVRGEKWANGKFLLSRSHIPSRSRPVLMIE